MLLPWVSSLSFFHCPSKSKVMLTLSRNRKEIPQGYLASEEIFPLLTLWLQFRVRGAAACTRSSKTPSWLGHRVFLSLQWPSVIEGALYWVVTSIYVRKCRIIYVILVWSIGKNSGLKYWKEEVWCMYFWTKPAVFKSQVGIHTITSFKDFWNQCVWGSKYQYFRFSDIISLIKICPSMKGNISVTNQLPKQMSRAIWATGDKILVFKITFSNVSWYNVLGILLMYLIKLNTSKGSKKEYKY